MRIVGDLELLKPVLNEGRRVGLFVLSLFNNFHFCFNETTLYVGSSQMYNFNIQEVSTL